MSRPHLPSFALSAEERAVVANRDIFAAKARAQATCREALLATHAALADIVRTVPLAAPTGLRAEAFQLVKGESLEDCPYQYLDYPKYFVRGEAFTFRTLIWWGHHLVCAWLIEERPYLRGAVRCWPTIPSWSIATCASASRRACGSGRWATGTRCRCAPIIGRRWRRCWNDARR